MTWMNALAHAAAAVDNRTPAQITASRVVCWQQPGVQPRQAMAQLVEMLDKAYDDLPAEIQSAFSQTLEKWAER